MFTFIDLVSDKIRFCNRYKMGVVVILGLGLGLTTTPILMYYALYDISK